MVPAKHHVPSNSQGGGMDLERWYGLETTNVQHVIMYSNRNNSSNHFTARFFIRKILSGLNASLLFLKSFGLPIAITPKIRQL